MKLPLLNKIQFSDLLWDLWCLVSVVGIWPRFIEPRLLSTKTLTFPVKGLQNELKIALFSDLHFHPGVKRSFLDKLFKKIEAFEPDIVIFLGDFICEGVLDQPEELLRFLNRFRPSLGTFAILGNHDYEETVGVNAEGDYDLIPKGSSFLKAFQRLFSRIRLTGKVTSRAKEVKEHQALIDLLKKSPFRLIYNENIKLETPAGPLNLVGLGEYMLGKALPEKAFEGYSKEHPGLVLVHNPDFIPHLSSYPGEMVFSGHTHGGQINLPWIWKKLAMMEHPRFKRGYLKEGAKEVYVTRGVGSIKPFRWNASPEWVKIYLRGAQ